MLGLKPGDLVEVFKKPRPQKHHPQKYFRSDNPHGFKGTQKVNLQNHEVGIVYAVSPGGTYLILLHGEPVRIYKRWVRKC